jgi:hypothetical protein
MVEVILIMKPAKLPSKNPIEAYQTLNAMEGIDNNSRMITKNTARVEIQVFPNIGSTTELNTITLKKMEPREVVIKTFRISSSEIK